jgi:predicted nucleic acid-binding protein
LILPYVDTSALAKWYISEPGSEAFEAFVAGFPRVVISRLTLVELRCLLARRRRAGEIAEPTADGAFQLFQSDIAQGHLEVCPLDDRHARGAVALLGQLRGHPLRTLDALHLAVAQTIGSQLVATADRVMAGAAEALGIRAVIFG